MSAALLHALSETGKTSSGEAILFWCLAPIMVLAGVGLLVVKKAVHAALLVITIMISLAILYIAQGAVFLGMVQVVVYTGAVMMLFLFVLMLVGVDGSDSLVETIRGQRWIAVIAGAGLACVLAGVVAKATYQVKGFTPEAVQNNPSGIAAILFGQYVFAFEVVGALLVTAALGALVLTHRQRLVPRVGQKERADARVAAGATLTPLPAPGRLRPAQRDGRPGARAGRSAARELGPARAADPRAGGRRRGVRRPDRPRARGRVRRGGQESRWLGRHRRRDGGDPVSLTHYLVLAAILFSLGATTVLLRRNAIIVFMGVELMLNATNLTLVTFSRIHGDLTGQVMAFFVMVVAAAEVVVGLSIIVAIFRTRRSASVDDVNLLKN